MNSQKKLNIFTLWNFKFKKRAPCSSSSVGILRLGYLLALVSLVENYRYVFFPINYRLHYLAKNETKNIGHIAM